MYNEEKLLKSLLADYQQYQSKLCGREGVKNLTFYVAESSTLVVLESIFISGCNRYLPYLKNVIPLHPRN
jgi:hypothetical protein